MKLKNLSLPFLAFLQATLLVTYISLVVLFMQNATRIFSPDPSFAPVLFLLVFIISAVISALLFLGRAGYLFWEKRYKEAFTLLGWTLGWALVYVVLVIIVLLIFSPSVTPMMKSRPTF